MRFDKNSIIITVGMVAVIALIVFMGHSIYTRETTHLEIIGDHELGLEYNTIEKSYTGRFLTAGHHRLEPHMISVEHSWQQAEKQYLPPKAIEDILFAEYRIRNIVKNSRRVGRIRDWTTTDWFKENKDTFITSGDGSKFDPDLSLAVNSRRLLMWASRLDDIRIEWRLPDEEEDLQELYDRYITQAHVWPDVNMGQFRVDVKRMISESDKIKTKKKSEDIPIESTR